MMSQKIIFLEGDNIFTSTKQEKIFGQNSPIKESNYIVFAFNDTLGNGRKLNLPLMLFIIQNINNIKKNKYDICCPIDSNARDFWICPYFFLGKISSIKTLL